jgi:paraquat-inducible protein B
MSQNLPKIEESRKFNFFTSIWIVPLIALLIAGWLVYQYYKELGPQIVITFEKNEGLVAGQSYIKYRNVPIGKVEKITLQKDGEGVVVTARMHKDAISYLNTSSKFWIVKPEVRISGVSGLDTLLSGTYIGMYAQKSDDDFISEFTGLNHPFHKDIEKGEYILLKTSQLESSIKVGTPVYFKNLKAGQVEYIILDADKVVNVVVYIKEEYKEFIGEDSKFWVRSVLNAEYNNGTIDFNIAPLTDILQGAIEFSSTQLENLKKLPDTFYFSLYPNQSSINTQHFANSNKEIKEFKVYTNEAISKLKVNAPVRFQGYKIGKVENINLHYDKEYKKMKSNILLSIDTSVFTDPSDKNHTGFDNFIQAFNDGLRVRLDTIDPLTGFLYINLVFDSNISNDSKPIIKDDEYMVLSTTSHRQKSIFDSTKSIVEKIDSLPLNDLLVSIEQLLEHTHKPIQHADELLLELKTITANLHHMTSQKSFKRMPNQINIVLRDLTKTLKTTRKVLKGYDSNSLISKQISQTLQIITQTSKDIHEFLRMLNRKPNSLIFGDK